MNIFGSDLSCFPELFRIWGRKNLVSTRETTKVWSNVLIRDFGFEEWSAIHCNCGLHFKLAFLHHINHCYTCCRLNGSLHRGLPLFATPQKSCRFFLCKLDGNNLGSWLNLRISLDLHAMFSTKAFSFSPIAILINLGRPGMKHKSFTAHFIAIWYHFIGITSSTYTSQGGNIGIVVTLGSSFLFSLFRW